MFTTFIVQPVFNLLVLIYGLLPGHNFGVAIIILTIVTRLLMWPLVKRQLHHTKAMRELQPEIKRIKKETKGDRQQESRMIMELYKERQINPFASIGLLLVQLPVLIALYSGITKLINDPSTIDTLTYSFLHPLIDGIESFDATFLGFVDLTKSAVGNDGSGIYWPAFIIVAASAVTQFYQSRQLMPNDKDAKGLKQILREAGTGTQADQADVNAAVGRSTQYLIPAMVFIFTIGLPAALPLYWLTSGLVAILQQRRVLGTDEAELEAGATKLSVIDRAKKAKEAEIIQKPKIKKTSSKKSKKAKRRKR